MVLEGEWVNEEDGSCMFTVRVYSISGVVREEIDGLLQVINYVWVMKTSSLKPYALNPKL